MTLIEAIHALKDDTDRRLTARPACWHRSGTALVLHGGGLFRLAPGVGRLTGPAHALTANEIIIPWEVIPEDAVRLEAEAEVEGKAETPIDRPLRADRKERRGRPSAEELRAELPEHERADWLGIVEAARIFKVGKDTIRRAIDSGELVVRTIRGVRFVQRDAVRGFVGASSRSVAPAPVEPMAVEPIAVELEEVFS